MIKLFGVIDLEAILNELSKPFSPRSVDYMYHGTRTLSGTILREGLRIHPFPKKILNTRQTFVKLGLDEYFWFRWLRAFSQSGVAWWLDPLAFHGVCCTDDYATAWSYALRAPEYLEDAIRSAALVRHPHSESRYQALNAKWQTEARQNTKPSVVVLAANHPSVNRPHGGHTEHLEVGQVPPDAIVRIDTKPEWSQMDPESVLFRDLNRRLREEGII